MAKTFNLYIDCHGRRKIYSDGPMPPRVAGKPFHNLTVVLEGIFLQELRLTTKDGVQTFDEQGGEVEILDSFFTIGRPVQYCASTNEDVRAFVLEISEGLPEPSVE